MLSTVERDGDEVEQITHFDPMTGEVYARLDHLAVFPATQYVTDRPTIERALDNIRAELEEQVRLLESQGKLLDSSCPCGAAFLPSCGREAGVSGVRKLLSGQEGRAVVLTRPGFVEEGRVMQLPPTDAGAAVIRAGGIDGIEVAVTAVADQARDPR